MVLWRCLCEDLVLGNVGAVQKGSASCTAPSAYFPGTEIMHCGARGTTHQCHPAFVNAPSEQTGWTCRNSEQLILAVTSYESI